MPDLPSNSAAEPLTLARDKVSILQKCAYGAATNVNYFSGQFLKVLSGQIFVAGMGMTPAGIGWVFLIFRLWDGMLDPFMGWITDNTRSRWGRRKPYLLAGGLLTGLVFPFLWLGRPEWSELWKFGWLIGAGMVFYAAYTLWAIPFQTLLSEMTPDPTERTSIAAYGSVFGTFSVVFGTWTWTLTQLPIFSNPATGLPDSLHGMRVISIGIAVVIVAFALLPVFVLKERNQEIVKRQPKKPFWSSLKVTFQNGPFRIIAIFGLVFSFGINLVQGQTFYLRTYYALAGDTVFAAKLGGIEGTLSMALNIATIPFFQWLARRIGKKETLVVATIILLFGTVISWFTYDPRHPWLALVTGMLLAPGYTGMFLVLPSMTADVMDYDELLTGSRNEGSIASVQAWLSKASTSLAYGLAGLIVVWCGFHIAQKAQQTPEAFLHMRLCFAIVPSVVLIPLLFYVWRYPLSYQKMDEVRAALEARRGVA